MDEIESTGSSDINIRTLDFSFLFELDTDMDVTNRTRYNFWDLLADVGGFNDGLFLIASLIFSSYSAFAYRNDLVGNLYLADDKN